MNDKRGFVLSMGMMGMLIGSGLWSTASLTYEFAFWLLCAFLAVGCGFVVSWLLVNERYGIKKKDEKRNEEY